MAQYVENTGGMAGPTSAEIQTTVNTLKAKMATGQVITAADINALKNCWNSFNNHYHAVADQWWVAFGNTSPYGTSSDDKNTAAATSGGAAGDATWANVTTSNTILASTHNDLRTRILSARTHYHTVDDRTGP